MTKIERVRIWNENFHKWNAFDMNGDTWVVMGNTYEIKDELKAKGAKFNYDLGWHFDHEEAGYPLVKVNITEVAEKNFEGKYYFDSECYTFIKRIRKAYDDAHTEPSTSEWIGEISKKVSIEVVLREKRFINSIYGESIVYEFEDTDGNTIVWITTSNKGFDKESIYALEGTVKDHTEFRGDKQTRLVRCKVLGEWERR